MIQKVRMKVSVNISPDSLQGKSKCIGFLHDMVLECMGYDEGPYIISNGELSSQQIELGDGALVPST